jgi:hypothetical protein
MPIERHADWNEADDVTWILPPPWGDGPEDDVSAALLLDVPAARARGVLRAKPLTRRPPGSGRRPPA